MASDQKRRSNGQFAPLNRGISALPSDAPTPPATVAERRAREDKATVGYLVLTWGFQENQIELGKRSAFSRPGFFEGELKVNGVSLVARREMSTPGPLAKAYRFYIYLHRPGLFGKRLTDEEVLEIRNRGTAE